jgi:hypothetical protein
MENFLAKEIGALIGQHMVGSKGETKTTLSSTKDTSSILEDSVNHTDLPPVEEIGAQYVEIIDAVDAIQQPLENKDAGIAVNFSQMINQPAIQEEVAKVVTSVPEQGEPKIKVVFPQNEHILGNYVDYDSFNKIKESNADIIIRSVRVLNFKMSDPNAVAAFNNFIMKFNPECDPNKRLKYELIRHQGREKDIVVRLSTVVNDVKYYADIYADLNKIDLDHHLISSAKKR